MNEDRLMQSVLLDFYGELLTEKQRDCFDLHYNEDLSLSEIAQQIGISRQGVWDNIRRAEESLKDIEEKTGLAARFFDTSRALEKLSKQLSRIEELSSGEAKSLAAQAKDDIEALLSRG